MQPVKWEIYNVNEDFSQANNLADKEPQKLRELQGLFWTEAEKYNVLPIDNSRVERFEVSLRPSLTRGREGFTYYPGLVRIPEGAAGAAGGALIGAMAGNAGLGAAIGAGVGLTGGFLYGKHKESEQKAYQPGYQQGQQSR